MFDTLKVFLRGMFGLGIEPLTMTALVAGGAAAGGGLGWLMGNKGTRDEYGTLNPEQRSLVKALGPQFQNIINTGPSGYQYTGQLNAPITAGEQGVVSQQARLGALSEGALAGIIDPDLKQLNQDFNQYVGDPTRQNFLTNVLPGAMEDTPFASTEYGRRKVEALANLEGQLGTAKFDAIQAARDRQLAGISSANQLAATGAAVQAIPREITQAGFDRSYQNFIQANAQYSNSLNQMLNFLGISTVTETPDTRKESALAGGLGGAQLGLSAATAGSNAAYQDKLLELLKSRQSTSLYTPTIYEGGNTMSPYYG